MSDYANLKDRVSYTERARIMRRQRWQDRMSLEQIGECWGICRERVRQILGNCGVTSGGFNYSKHMRTLNNPDWQAAHVGHTNPEIAAELGVKTVSRGSFFHAVAGDCKQAVNAEWVAWASQVLRDKGFLNRPMPLKASCDIQLNNGTRVTVRVATTTCATSESLMSPQYHFTLARRGGPRPECDVYLCIIAETEECFVIPAWKIRPDQHEIYFCWPSRRPELGKWQQYKDRWNLLERGRA